MTTANNEVFIGLQQEYYCLVGGINLWWQGGAYWEIFPGGQIDKIFSSHHPPSRENPAFYQPLPFYAKIPPPPQPLFGKIWRLKLALYNKGIPTILSF